MARRRLYLTKLLLSVGSACSLQTDSHGRTAPLPCDDRASWLLLAWPFMSSDLVTDSLRR